MEKHAMVMEPIEDPNYDLRKASPSNKEKNPKSAREERPVNAALRIVADKKEK